MKSVSFVIEGEPMAKQRPRLSTFNGYARAYTPKDTERYENKVLMCYKNSLNNEINEVMFPQGTYVKLSLEAYFGLTKGDYGKKGLNKSGKNKINGVYCDKHKDLDNIIKIVMDALNGICFNDDKQIVCIEAYKLYTQDLPRVEVSFEQIGVYDNKEIG